MALARLIPPPRRQISISPPGDLAATFYAPGADMTINGNPDIIGAIRRQEFLCEWQRQLAL